MAGCRARERAALLRDQIKELRGPAEKTAKKKKRVNYRKK